MDKKLLLDIFRVPSMSGSEEGMAFYIKEYLKKLDIPFKTDAIGNIFYYEYEGKPLLSAHMDSVQDIDDASLTRFIKIRGNRVLSGYGVIGGDDKCGIYIILQLLKSMKVNFLFTVEEETGGAGSRNFIKDNDISHLPYGLILDRRGSGDIICEFNEYGTLEFEKVLEGIGEPFGYSKNTGTFSDGDYISEQISCANLSVGYYNWHSKTEFVDLEDLERAFDFTYAIVTNVTAKFDKPEKDLSGYNKFIGRHDYMYGMDESFYEGIEEQNYCDFCGNGTLKWKKLRSINRIACEECFKKLEDEILYGSDFISNDADMILDEYYDN